MHFRKTPVSRNPGLQNIHKQKNQNSLLYVLETIDIGLLASLSLKTYLFQARSAPPAQLTYLQKQSIIDLLLGSKYVSALLQDAEAGLCTNFLNLK